MRIIYFMAMVAVFPWDMSLAACPDFSGKYFYQGEDGTVELSLKQSRCKTIRMDETSGYLNQPSREQHLLVLDNRFHPGSGWFGGDEKYFTAAKMMGKKLEIESKDQPGDSEFSWKERYILTPGKDLIIQDYDKATQRYDEGVLFQRR